jgi:hypothetical protein
MFKILYKIDLRVGLALLFKLKVQFFLTLGWMIFQMILAVYTLHMDFNLYHGNIRTSNFILTNY